MKIEESAIFDAAYLSLKKLLADRIGAIYAYLYESIVYISKKEKAFYKIKLVEVLGEPIYIYAGYSPKLDPKIRKTIEKQINIQIYDKNLK